MDDTKQLRPMCDLIGKTVIGATTGNLDGGKAERLVLRFDDGSTLEVTTDWQDEPGWASFEVSYGTF